jgi:hypothetical protein
MVPPDDSGDSTGSGDLLISEVLDVRSQKLRPSFMCEVVKSEYVAGIRT